MSGGGVYFVPSGRKSRQVIARPDSPLAQRCSAQIAEPSNRLVAGIAGLERARTLGNGCATGDAMDKLELNQAALAATEK